MSFLPIVNNHYHRHHCLLWETIFLMVYYWVFVSPTSSANQGEKRGGRRLALSWVSFTFSALSSFNVASPKFECSFLQRQWHIILWCRSCQHKWEFKSAVSTPQIWSSSSLYSWVRYYFCILHDEASSQYNEWICAKLTLTGADPNIYCF